MNKRFIAGVVLGTIIFCNAPSDGADAPKKPGFFESLFNRKKDSSAGADDLSSLSTSQITTGIKDAVEKGLRSAVNNLGRTNGFLTNAAVRIGVPDQLKTVETALRKLHQDALVDEFETSMNRAAEKAVPAGAEVLLGSLKQMSVEDAKNLVTSQSPTAITDYFRRTSTNELAQKFLPIVQEATAQAGVTSTYKELLGKVSFGGFSLLNRPSLDVDQYVTHKGLDGLFVMIGEEEKRIRENPAARTTELLQKVFGAVRKQ